MNDGARRTLLRKKTDHAAVMQSEQGTDPINLSKGRFSRTRNYHYMAGSDGSMEALQCDVVIHAADGAQKELQSRDIANSRRDFEHRQFALESTRV